MTGEKILDALGYAVSTAAEAARENAKPALARRFDLLDGRIRRIEYVFYDVLPDVEVELPWSCPSCGAAFERDPSDAGVRYCPVCGREAGSLNEVDLEAVRIVRADLSDDGRRALGHLLRNAVFPLRVELERPPGDRDETFVASAFGRLLEVVEALARRDR